MKVLQLLLSPRIGGAETLADALKEHWKNWGVESRVAYLDADGFQTSNRLRRLQRVRTAAQEFAPDIVLSHTALPNAYARLALGRSTTVIPVLHSSADDYSSRTLRHTEILFSRYRREPIIAVSPVARATYTKWFPDNHRIRIIENGVSDPGIVTIGETNKLKVLTLSRVSPAKNPGLWASVAKHFAMKGSRIDFSWIGPVGNEEEVQVVVQGHEVASSHGKFLGALDNGTSVLPDYGLYFHPADRESFGIAVVEAILSGIPVVCSDAVASAVDHNLVAETFKPGDAGSAIEAIERAYLNYSSHLASSPFKREIALQKYSMDKCAASYIEVFESVVKQQPLSSLSGFRR